MPVCVRFAYVFRVFIGGVQGPLISTDQRLNEISAAHLHTQGESPKTNQNWGFLSLCNKKNMVHFAFFLALVMGKYLEKRYKNILSSLNAHVLS